jgi:hypothetical protein
MAIGEVHIRDLAKWPQKVVDQYRGVIMTAAEQTLQIEGLQVIQQTIDSTQPHPPVNTGSYRRRWRVSRIPDGIRLGNGDKIAGVIEDGRRPGTGVSQEGQQAIARWVHLHGMDKVTLRERSTSAERARLRLAKDVGAGYLGVVKTKVMEDREARFTQGKRKRLRTARALGATALRMAKAGERQRFIDATEKKAMTVAFLIARAIKRRGLPAKNILGRAKKQITDLVMRNIYLAMGKEAPK